MVGADLKAEIMKLMEKRSALEAEMNAIIESLCQPGGPGLSRNLVDSEGFPRADIDIPTVRANRCRLAVLRNDHEDITEKINQNIQVLHSAKLAPTSVAAEDTSDMVTNNHSTNIGISATSNYSDLGSTSSAMNVDVILSKPFAMVDEITEGSPAAEDGLQLGDQVVKFGHVEFGENLLQRLAAEAQANRGQALPMIVLRQGAIINLTVTPRVWEGRGLLGCHFRIL
ncbi:hypothetical protein M9H77_07193 [Catharanthus roseus]|uniref:Uncharacterized protein n=1 Tax=Catharanthus roseus TaxID=4058 RepID=A0ACC0BUM6_CATRO|nr:hypothetical protein M9H77_07193 [Catharanthus roseus]